MLENSIRNLFTDEKTTKEVLLMFLDIKSVTKPSQFFFRAVPRNKEDRVSVFNV